MPNDLQLSDQDEVLLESLVLAASDNVARAPASDRDQYAPERRRAFVETSGAGNVYLGTGSAWVDVSENTGLLSSLFGGGDGNFDSVNTEQAVTDLLEDTQTRSGKLPADGEGRTSSQSVTKRTAETYVAWIFDDARISIYEERDIFEANGLEIGLGVPTSLVGTSGHMSWDQLDELTRDPYNFWIHSHGESNTGFDSRTKSEIEQDVYDAYQTHIQKAKEYSNPNLLPADQYVYVSGQAPEKARGIVADLYEHGITATDGLVSDSDGPYRVFRTGTGTETQSFIDTKVDNAVSNSTGLFLMGHDVSTNGTANEGPLETSREKVQGIYDYVTTKTGAQWGTPKDVIDNVPSLWKVGGEDGSIQQVGTDIEHQFPGGGRTRWFDSDGNVIGVMFEDGFFYYSPSGTFEMDPSGNIVANSRFNQATDTIDWTSGRKSTTSDAMTANPESDTEDGYIEIRLDGTLYQVPVYTP